jgi:Ulp1 family protease
MRYNAIEGLQVPTEKRKDWTFACCQDTIPMQNNEWDCGLYAVTYGMCVGLQASFKDVYLSSSIL